MSDYYFITSKLNGNVLDIQGGNVAPKPPIISYPQNSPAGDNQLWTFASEGSSLSKKSAFA
jgi:hypothetical protein